MLSKTILALGLGSLALAAPAPQQTHTHSEDSSSSDVSSSSSADYGDYLNVNPYSNVEASSEWAAGKVNEYPIRFCNTSETAMLRRGLYDAEVLAAHARDHIHRWGNSSSYYKKYFGMAPTAEPAGWFDKIVNTDKSQYLFRCDDPDLNCANNATWHGHWRGENGTTETVICPPSFIDRWNLDAMCMRGYEVATSAYTTFWASDLHHRLFHTPVGEGTVDHFSDEYGPSLELAMTSPEDAVRNTESLTLFALDVYAYDVAAPNVGCTGTYEPEEEEEEVIPETSTMSSSSSMAMTTSSSVPVESAVEATTTAVEEPTTTATADESCHTHEDGVVHCV